MLLAYRKSYASTLWISFSTISGIHIVAEFTQNCHSSRRHPMLPVMHRLAFQQSMFGLTGLVSAVSHRCLCVLDKPKCQQSACKRCDASQLNTHVEYWNMTMAWSNVSSLDFDGRLETNVEEEGMRTPDSCLPYS